MNSPSLFLVCLIFLLPLSESYADRYPFERLFTSAELRDTLNATRYIDESSRYANTVDFSSDAMADILPKDEFVKISGIVMHENGKNMVWINGKSDLSKKPDYTKEDFYLGKDRKVRIKKDGDSRKLKAGQVWVLERDDVKEGFEITMPKPRVPINQLGDKNQIHIQDALSVDAAQVLLDAVGRQ